MAENEGKVEIMNSVESSQVIYGPAPQNPTGDGTLDIKNSVESSQIIYGPAPKDTISEGSTESTTDSTTPNADASTMSNVVDNQVEKTNSETSTISEPEATTPNTRTNTEQQMKIKSDGTMLIDEKVATNEQLEEYFDYTKYSDQQSAKMVEGLLKSDTVTINGVSYRAELNQNGEMVSTDGSRRLTQEEIKGYFGEKGYEALVCKTTKNITVDENGKIKIEDREKSVKMTIAEPVIDTNKSNTPTKEQLKEKSDKDKIKDAKSAGFSSGGGYSGGGGGYSGGGSYSGGGNSSSGGKSPSEEEVEDAGTPVIMVDFGSLEAIRDELQTLKGQLSGVCDDYGSTINGLSGNSSAWSGSDKDTYVSQKKGYVTNIGQVSSTLDAFVVYLDTCVNNYKELEAKLAAKQIS